MNYQLLCCSDPQYLSIRQLLWGCDRGNVELAVLQTLEPFRTCAVTLSNLEKVMKFFQVNRFSMEFFDSTVTRLSDFIAINFNSMEHSSGMDLGSLSVQGAAPAFSHSGPCCHGWLTESCRVVSPHEGKSAGLDFPGQCLQTSRCTFRQISLTLFWSTNPI